MGFVAHNVVDPLVKLDNCSICATYSWWPVLSTDREMVCLPSPRSKEMVRLDREVLISSAVTAPHPSTSRSQLRLAQPERGPAAEWPVY